MPHEITIRENGFAEIAFVDKTPWHGLGQQLTRDASLEDWRREAGLDWHIEKVPVLYDTGTIISPYKGQNVLYRSDNGTDLSIVSDKYHVVQPATVLEFFRDLVDSKGYRLHTAGTLKGGRRIWALAEIGKVQEVVSNDPVGGFLLLATSCDKGLATTARFTSVRVVCANTLAMAERSADYVSIDHTRRFDITETHQALGLQVSAFDTFMAQARGLAAKPLSGAKFDDFLDRLLTPHIRTNTPEDFIVENTRTYKKIQELMAGAAMGSELPGVSGTWWGAVNAVTEYVDHHKPARDTDSRLNGAWFSHGATLKNNALALALAA
jgi:phage/plasmid-like protein (TIGR03299 family)